MGRTSYRAPPPRIAALLRVRGLSLSDPVANSPAHDANFAPFCFCNEVIALFKLNINYCSKCALDLPVSCMRSRCPCALHACAVACMHLMGEDEKQFSNQMIFMSGVVSKRTRRGAQMQASGGNGSGRSIDARIAEHAILLLH